MMIVERTHNRTYRPELYISLRAFGAQDFDVTAFAPSALRLLLNMGLIETWQNFALCTSLHVGKFGSNLYH